MPVSCYLFICLLFIIRAPQMIIDDSQILDSISLMLNAAISAFAALAAVIAVLWRKIIKMDQEQKQAEIACRKQLERLWRKVLDAACPHASITDRRFIERRLIDKPVHNDKRSKDRRKS